MDVLEIEWKTERQKSVVLNLLEELQVTYRSVTSDKEDENGLHGDQLKHVILEGKKAYESGDRSQFTKIKTADLWK